MDKLTAKQKIFIDEYLKSYNATQAAVAAGYSEKTAYSIGWENLRKPEISEAVQRRLQESAMTADENLMHIGEIARQVLSPAFFFREESIFDVDKDGNAFEVSRIGLDWEKLETYGHLVKSISFTANGPKIELYDRLKALELIGKHHKLFTDTVEHQGLEPLKDWLEALRGKADGE